MDDHPGFEVTRAAKRRAHRHDRKLQRHRRDEPEQVALGLLLHGRVCAERRRVRGAIEHRDGQKGDAGRHRQDLRLVEQKRRAVVLLPPRRMRHHRRRTDAQHLREGQHHERQVGTDADRGYGIGAEPPDPEQIDQHIERLKDHADEHEAGGLDQMAGERSCGEVLHRRVTLELYPPRSWHRRAIS